MITNLPNGTYNYLIKGRRSLASAGTLTLPMFGMGANFEFGTQRAGDANNNNVITVQDFNLVKTEFGTSGSGLPADFNNDGVVNSLDFNLMKVNYGQAGASLTCP